MLQDRKLPPTGLRTLQKYLTRQVIVSLLMTLTVFTFVLLLGNILKEVLPRLISRQASVRLVFEAVGLLIPFVWAYGLPMAMLSATLLVFGRFSADQELTAARASGISLVSLVTPILLLSLAFCGLSATVNLELGPRCRMAYKNLVFRFTAEISNVVLPEGRYSKDVPGYVIFVAKNRGGNLEDVLIYRTKDNTTAQAPRGRVELDLTNRQATLRLFDARVVSYERDHAETVFLRDSVIGPFKLDGERSTQTRTPISDMTFIQLREELRDLEKRMALPLDLGKRDAESGRRIKEDHERQLRDLTSPVRVHMHRQVAFSFACFGFTLVGIPLGIRVHRRETNVGFALALALACVYYSVILIGLALSARPEWAPHIIVWLPNLIFQGVGAVLLWRANRGI